ncbi:hypothetical protein BGZ50_002614 [Haplosporangium sp. Z 11]|nr:hypothetical protein BGZ50_002614 [Haplosporangium sp. Z 11]
MGYINSTTVTFVAAGLGAAAYYIYSNVIEPHQKAQKDFQAEQAQRGLLELKEKELAKRGTNKQVATKKQALATSHQKKVGHQNDDCSAEDVNETIETFNPFNLLDAAAATISISGKSLKKNQTRGDREMAREPEILCAPEQATLARDGSTKDARHPHALASLDPVKPAIARGPSNTAPTSTSTLLMSSSSSIEMMTVAKEVFEKVVLIEQSIPNPNHELATLQALLKAKERALIAADARIEEANHRILELQKQVEADTEAVKVAKKAETGARKREERLESLTYTNSLLVQQLTLERENQSAAEKNLKQGDSSNTETSTTRVTELVARVEDLEQRRIQATAQIKQLQELDQDKQQRLNEAECRANAAMQEKEEIHRQAAALLSEKDERIATLEMDLAALEDELEAAKRQLEQYVDAVEHLEAVSRTQCESLESEKCSLFEETEILRAELADDSEMRKRQEVELRRVQRQLSKIESEHSECAIQYDEILVAKESLGLELVMKTQEFEAMMEGKAAVDAQLEAFIRESKEKRMEFEEERDVLLLRVVELEHQLAGFQRKETREKSDAKDVKVSETFEIQVASEPKQGVEVEYLEQEEEPQPFSVQLGVAIATF